MTYLMIFNCAYQKFKSSKTIKSGTEIIFLVLLPPSLLLHNWEPRRVFTSSFSCTLYVHAMLLIRAAFYKSTLQLQVIFNFESLITMFEHAFMHTMLMLWLTVNTRNKTFSWKSFVLCINYKFILYYTTFLILL